MKKNCIFILLFIALLFSACVQAGDNNSTPASSSGANSSGSNTTEDDAKEYKGNYTSASKEKTESYDDNSENLFEVSSDTEKFKVSSVPAGKTVWLVRTNPENCRIPARSTRYVKAVQNITLASGNVSESSYSNFENGWSRAAASCHSVNLNKNLSFNFNSFSSARTQEKATGDVVQVLDYKVGDSKEIYIDTNSSMSTYRKESAHLRSKGTYCYVWVVDDYYGTVTSGGKKIDASIAKKIAENFDKIYPMVREVFGHESDKIIYQGTEIRSMENYSDTGNLVNIVVYDIGNDYSSQSKGGVVGYFYAKDYYYNYSGTASNTAYLYSNAGKYFYIDSYYAANETSTVYSTLAHEFQHMVDFGVKTLASAEKDVNSVLTSSTWYNEMKSMLCEDLMKNWLENNNEDFTDDNTPLSRLPMFCRRYYDVGLEYRSGGSSNANLYISYANNYAFGAWAVRNYGGVSFINRLSTNAFVDTASIEEASGESIEVMLQKYALACIFNKAEYGFNKSLTQTGYKSNGYYYPLDAINLWKLKEILPEFYSEYIESNQNNVSTYYSFDGPVYFACDKQADLRPYGFFLMKAGEVMTDGEILLQFNSDSSASGQKVYVIIE